MTNRLANEQSPYLVQHGDNPVDWYPWGEEAFQKARVENKPVFLSIGYSTCHWCHVMAEESFEDAEVARLMNDTFISIKVDREERPDIDSVYMTVCQMLTGNGGWPLTILMTPEKEPFFAATYIPKKSRFGMAGMTDLIPRVRQMWDTRQDAITETVGQIKAALAQTASAAPGRGPGQAEMDAAYGQLKERYDARNGGFGASPKFPTPHNLLFLLRRWKRAGDPEALEMVERTLRSMRLGGIYDHLGFGFHRYSTDSYWLVPHFEKMLYDQALIATACVETYQATGREEYAATAQEVFTYVLRDMRSPEGGFYSAEDADSEGEEGKFYLWTKDEIESVLTPAEAQLAVETFDIRTDGNFTSEAGARPVNNILHLAAPHAENTEIEAVRQKLFAHREERAHPHKDDKVLTDWNGLMIAALAAAGRVLGEPAYIEAAASAADFILNKLRTPDGRLLHRYRNGQAAITANAGDYAFLIHGLLELYESTFEVRYLTDALALNSDMLEHFWDAGEGGLFFTADDAEELLVRRKEFTDGALPSANSVAMLDLLKLGRLTGETALEEKAAEIGRAASASVDSLPLAHTQLLAAVDFALGPSYEVVIAGDPAGKDTAAMLAVLRREFVPNKVVILRPAGEESPAIDKVSSFVIANVSIGGKATAYVCRNYSCEMPVTEPEKMLELLK